MDDSIPLGSSHISTAADMASICKMQMITKNCIILFIVLVSWG